MVFSPTLDADRFGQVQIVPCRRNSGGVNALLDEVVELWAAETNNSPDRSKGQFSSSWGCVGLLCHPQRAQNLEELRTRWSDIVSDSEIYKNFKTAKLHNGSEEEAHVDSKGFLQIPWPKGIYGTPIEFDLLLATANCPEEEKYPSPEQIATPWKKDDGKKYVDYFWNNQYFNIRTFQDDEIQQALKGGKTKCSN